MTSPKPAKPPRRLLIFRVGSLGDTLVALPALHLIARSFPEAERRILTNFSVSEKAAPMADLLDGTGLVQGYFPFPPRSYDPAALFKLVKNIRRWGPDLLIHLHDARGRAIAVRDLLFFRACGISRMIGVPRGKAGAPPLFKPEAGLYEHKAELLARRLSALGDARLSDRASWDLRLSDDERRTASQALAPLSGGQGFLSVSIGAKVDVKDWGDDNWRSLLCELGSRLPGWKLAMIGAPVEHARSASLLAHWPGRGINLCGHLSLRQSAAVLEQSAVYIGHDSGPMHLAASVGTPCVAIFSARNYPGEWYPYGEGHTVLYHQTACFGCNLDVCTQFGKECILSIGANSVAEAVLKQLRNEKSRIGLA